MWGTRGKDGDASLRSPSAFGAWKRSFIFSPTRRLSEAGGRQEPVVSSEAPGKVKSPLLEKTWR